MVSSTCGRMGGVSEISGTNDRTEASASASTKAGAGSGADSGGNQDAPLEFIPSVSALVSLIDESVSGRTN